MAAQWRAMVAVDLGAGDAARQFVIRDGVGGDGDGNFALLGAALGTAEPRAGLVAVVASEECARAGAIVGPLAGTRTPTRLSFEVRRDGTGDDAAYDRTVDLLAVADPRAQLFVAPVGEAVSADGLFWTTRDDDDNGSKWSVPAATALAHGGGTGLYHSRVWTAPTIGALGPGSYVRFQPNAVQYADAVVGFGARGTVSTGYSYADLDYAVVAVGPRDAVPAVALVPPAFDRSVSLSVVEGAFVATDNDQYVEADWAAVFGDSFAYIHNYHVQEALAALAGGADDTFLLQLFVNATGKYTIAWDTPGYPMAIQTDTGTTGDSGLWYTTNVEFLDGSAYNAEAGRLTIAVGDDSPEFLYVQCQTDPSMYGRIEIRRRWGIADQYMRLVSGSPTSPTAENPLVIESANGTLKYATSAANQEDPRSWWRELSDTNNRLVRYPNAADDWFGNGPSDGKNAPAARYAVLVRGAGTYRITCHADSGVSAMVNVTRPTTSNSTIAWMHSAAYTNGAISAQTSSGDGVFSVANFDDDRDDAFYAYVDGYRYRYGTVTEGSYRNVDGALPGYLPHGFWEAPSVSLEIALDVGDMVEFRYDSPKCTSFSHSHNPTPWYGLDRARFTIGAVSSVSGGTPATGPVLRVRAGGEDVVSGVAWSAGDVVEARYRAGNVFETLLNGAPVPNTQHSPDPSPADGMVAGLLVYGGPAQTFAHVDAVLVDAADGDTRHTSATPLRRTPPLLLPAASSGDDDDAAAAAAPPTPANGESQELTAAQVVAAFPDLGLDPETDAGGWNARFLRVRTAHAADARAEVVGVAEPFLVLDHDGGQHFPCYASAARAAADPHADPAGAPRAIDLGSAGTYYAAAVDTATHYAYAGHEPILASGFHVGPHAPQPHRLYLLPTSAHGVEVRLDAYPGVVFYAADPAPTTELAPPPPEVARDDVAVLFTDWRRSMARGANAFLASVGGDHARRKRAVQLLAGSPSVVVADDLPGATLELAQLVRPSTASPRLAEPTDLDVLLYMLYAVFLDAGFLQHDAAPALDAGASAEAATFGYDADADATQGTDADGVGVVGQLADTVLRALVKSARLTFEPARVRADLFPSGVATGTFGAEALRDFFGVGADYGALIADIEAAQPVRIAALHGIPSVRAALPIFSRLIREGAFTSVSTALLEVDGLDHTAAGGRVPAIADGSALAFPVDIRVADADAPRRAVVRLVDHRATARKLRAGVPEAVFAAEAAAPAEAPDGEADAVSYEATAHTDYAPSARLTFGDAAAAGVLARSNAGLDGIGPATGATLEAWIKLSGSGDRAVVGKGDGGYGLVVTSANKLAFRGEQASLTSDFDVPTGRWVHVAASVHPSDGATLVLFDDAAQPPLPSQQSATSAPFTPSFGSGAAGSPLVIGAEGGTAQSSLFQGSIRELRVWGRALTLEEIAATRAQLLPPRTAGLAAHYLFATDDARALDRSGNNNHQETAGWPDGVAVEAEGGGWTAPRVDHAFARDAGGELRYTGADLSHVSSVDVVVRDASGAERHRTTWTVRHGAGVRFVPHLGVTVVDESTRPSGSTVPDRFALVGFAPRANLPGDLTTVSGSFHPDHADADAAPDAAFVLDATGLLAATAPPVGEKATLAIAWSETATRDLDREDPITAYTQAVRFDVPDGATLTLPHATPSSYAAVDLAFLHDRTWTPASDGGDAGILPSPMYVAPDGLSVSGGTSYGLVERGDVSNAAERMDWVPENSSNARAVYVGTGGKTRGFVKRNADGAAARGAAGHAVVPPPYMALWMKL